MSDSRLEKFIYAICSMDVSDLPVPLSRIEKLWNCLITGETPDFEPLSRNEKYLMAMLDRYDISNLPAPMSRGEKLLYKIAVGETYLSDVPGYLSRYEELLKYLIENGVLSDFEYVLYTLNQSLSTLYATVEKPVKSAILKGQTLVNLLQNAYVSDGIMRNGNVSYSKADTTYTLIYNVITLPTTAIRSTFMVSLSNGTKIYQSVSPTVQHKMGINKWVFKTPTDAAFDGIRYWSNDEDIKLCANNIVLLEGDYTQENIPYFEGMQSVKMPVLKTCGKNLCDNSKNKAIEINSTTGEEYVSANSNVIVSDYIEINPLKTYVASKVTPLELGSITFRYYNDKKEYIGINKTNEAKYVRLRQTNQNGSLNSDDILFQLEEGSIATSYEPYKSNILTTPEDVTLRGIGEVRDELDLLTGEVIERIGEYVVNEQSNITIARQNDNFIMFDITDIENVQTKLNAKVISDKFINATYTINPTKEMITLWSDNSKKSVISITISKNKLSDNTINAMKEYLLNNNVKIQYPLAIESVKTVDLTTVDQDGQPTKLKTFNDISYVEINADNTIPSVDVEVATKISETLATLDPQHHDISNAQNKLGQTIDEQTENTDATMMATTEIYEQTL